MTPSYKKSSRLQNVLFSTGMQDPAYHLVNKAVMKQNCVETLNKHGQPLENEAAFLNLIRNI